MITFLFLIVENLSNKKIRNAVTYEINIWMKGENKVDEGNLRMSSTRQSIWQDSLCGRGKKITMTGK